MSTSTDARGREAVARDVLAEQFTDPEMIALVKAGENGLTSLSQATAAMLAYADRLASERERGGEDVERWRHVKRGTEYEVIGRAELQAEQPQFEHAHLVIYRGNDGKLWARNSAEFADGRFQPLSTPPTTAGEDKADGRVEAVREAVDTARAKTIIESKLNRVWSWLQSIQDCDLTEIVADGGITAGMVVQQEARDIQMPLIDAAIENLGLFDAALPTQEPTPSRERER